MHDLPQYHHLVAQSDGNMMHEPMGVSVLK
jgi:hypothetical protein